MRRVVDLIMAGVLFGVAPSYADVFHAGGQTIATMSATNAGATCNVSKGARFDLAPSPESSASVPHVLISVKLPAISISGTECPQNIKLKVTSDELDSSAKYEEWTVGGAIIPFKYYATGDRGVSGNTSALGYLGYKWHAPGGGLILGLGAGPTVVNIGDGAQNSQQTGASAAILLLGQVGYTSTAQFGIAIGKDKVSKSAGWVNNGATWIGFQIGAKIF